MDIPLDLLATEASETILLDNYTGHGILLFDGDTLWLVIGLHSGNDGKAYCSRRIKLCIDPALSSGEKFNMMHVNRNGSRVALCSAHLVYVIELPNDFWCRQSVTPNPLTEHLQATYHCRSHCIGGNIRSTSTAADFLKIRWCRKGRYDCGHRICNRLAVLCSSNIVRIYDTDAGCSTPVLQIDFKSVLGLNELSSPRSIGAYNYIASFDFGPSFVSKNDENDDDAEEIHLKTLFAIDNDCGDIYIAVYSDDRVYEVQGPIAITGTEPGDFASAFDMLYLEYQEKETLPVFSLISSQGRISHFVVITADEEASNGHMEFVLVSYDSLLLPCKPLANVSYCLQNDPVQSGQYFVLCGASLFSVDIKPWAYLLSKLLLAGANLEESGKELLNSKICHIFRVLGNNNSSSSSSGRDLEDAITVATTANTIGNECINACDDDDDDICKVFDQKDIVFIAATSSKQLLIKFTKQEVIWDEKSTVIRRHRMPVEEIPQNYLVEEYFKIIQSQVMVPKFRINQSISEPEALAVASDVIDALIENMKITQVAFKRVQCIINEDIRSLETINNNKSLCTKRLLQLLSTYIDLKNRIYKIQKTVGQLKKRSDALSSGLMPKMFPLTDAEKALESKLETLRIEVDGITRQLPYLANEVATKRRERFGPVRSFSASINAQKFMLSKNTEDINEMVNWTKQLGKKIDALQTNVVTEEALSTTSPKPKPQL